MLVALLCLEDPGGTNQLSLGSEFTAQPNAGCIPLFTPYNQSCQMLEPLEIFGGGEI